jgi:hypothetical protein
VFVFLVLHVILRKYFYSEFPLGPYNFTEKWLCFSPVSTVLLYFFFKYKCRLPCPRTNSGCSQNHACKKKCYEECGKCEELVKKELPACGHKVNMLCSEDPATFLCKSHCERTMKCGHNCKKICSDECGGCTKRVTKTVPLCGHEVSPGHVCITSNLRSTHNELPDTYFNNLKGT